MANHERYAKAATGKILSDGERTMYILTDAS